MTCFEARVTSEQNNVKVYMCSLSLKTTLAYTERINVPIFKLKSTRIDSWIEVTRPMQRCSIWQWSYRLDRACLCRNADVRSPSYSGVARGLVDGLVNFATLSTNKPHWKLAVHIY